MRFLPPVPHAAPVGTLSFEFLQSPSHGRTAPSAQVEEVCPPRIRCRSCLENLTLDVAVLWRAHESCTERRWCGPGALRRDRFLQGINVLPGSFMTGQIQWAVYGGIAVATGIALLLVAKRWRNR